MFLFQASTYMPRFYLVIPNKQPTCPRRQVGNNKEKRKADRLFYTYLLLTIHDSRFYFITAYCRVCRSPRFVFTWIK